jgi:hypothetical protein
MRHDGGVLVGLCVGVQSWGVVRCLACFDAVDEKQVMQSLGGVEVDTLGEDASGFGACFRDDFVLRISL